MFFRKNLPGIERAIRIASGICLIGVGVSFAAGNLTQWLSIGAGITAVCTGFIGFCPMCAMAGRKL